MRIEKVPSNNLDFNYITAKFSRFPNAEPKTYAIVGFMTTTRNFGFDIAPNKRNVYLLREFIEYLKKENKFDELKKLIFGDTDKSPEWLGKSKIGALTEFWVIESNIT